MLIEVGDPHLKWQIGGLMTDRLAATSTEYVQTTVFAASGGVPVNPTTGTAQFAFESGTGDPADGDWVAGSWDVTDIGGYVAQCNVGPNGTTALTAGDYWVWVQITLYPETVVRSCGQLVVF